MTYKPKYEKLLDDPKIKRWYENLKARSLVTATVYLRYLGHYCEVAKTDPNKLIKIAKTNKNREDFEDFVRDLEKKGKAGSYISKYKKVINSWLKYNYVDIKLKVNIKGENETPTLVNERVPTKEELAKIIRNATMRARVSIAIMAFSGVRPESLGDYSGSDGIKLGDFSELEFTNTGVEFKVSPTILNIRSTLSKARHQYFTFIPEEGLTYIKEYLNERKRNGEKLTENSPLLQFDPRGIKHNNFMRTALVTRDIREAIRSAGLKMRPYVLRAYFATALDIAESKGIISHPWRMFMMGHKGDIEARYSTNKRLPPDVIEEMRTAYQKCTKFLETRISEPSENDAKLYLQQQLLLAVGYKQEEIDKMDLTSMTNEDFQKLLRDKVTGTMTQNGSKQKLINVEDVEKYLTDGYEVVTTLNNGKVVMKLPF